jgi:adenylate cyclase
VARRPRAVSTALCLGLAILLAGVRLIAPAPLEQLELKAIDLRHLIRGPQPTTGQIAIVGIDEASLEQVGRWPWPRNKLADLVDGIAKAGASVIALDAVFDKPDPGVDLARLEAAVQAAPKRSARELVDGLGVTLGNDARFAQTLRDSGRVVLGEFFELGPIPEPRPPTPFFPEMAVRLRGGGTLDAIREAARFHGNVQMLEEAAAAVGHVNFVPDADGGFRRVPLALRMGEAVAPALSLAALQRHLGSAAPLLTIDHDGVSSLTVGDRALPSDPSGELRIEFRGPPKTFPHVSAADVLAGHTPPGVLDGRIVLVAPTAVGFDSRPTPFSGSMPGVEIHANVIDNLLVGRGLWRPPWTVPVETLVILVLGGIIALLLRRRGIVGPIAALLLGVFYLWGTQRAFAVDGLVLAAVYPTLAVIGCTLAGTLYQYVAEASERKYIRDAFGMYLDPDVTELVASDPSRLKLGGERRDISILFSDLRGFSSIAERLTVDDLALLMNEHLGTMTDVVFAHRGLLDKYVGDAVMALWGAPLDAPDHAHRAAAAALEMNTALTTLQKSWRARGWPHVEMGIGIDSGETVVGNFGSARRFSYTAMGDHVNVASRLEGLNKVYGTTILLSENTFSAVRDDFVCREVDRVRVVGRGTPVSIYELLCHRRDDQDGRRQAMVDRFLPALAAYRERRFEDAAAMLAAATDDPVAMAYVGRCSALAASPPADGWDGVYDVRTK